MNYDLSKVKIFFLKNDKAIEIQLLCNYFRCYEKYKVTVKYGILSNVKFFNF